MNKAVSLLLGILVLSSSVGCTTVRNMTARQWIDPSSVGPAAPVAKAAPPAEGAPPAAGGEAAPAPAAPPGGIASHFYLTYWEGKCSQFGCSRGATHVKRCKVAADNAVSCVDEAEATKALSPE